MNWNLLTNEEIDALLNNYNVPKLKEGKAIYHTNVQPNWSHLNNEIGIVKSVNGQQVFTPQNDKFSGKIKKNTYVVQEANLEFLLEW